MVIAEGNVMIRLTDPGRWSANAAFHARSGTVKAVERAPSAPGLGETSGALLVAGAGLRAWIGRRRAPNDAAAFTVGAMQG